MKNIVIILILLISLFGCNSTKTLNSDNIEISSTSNDTVKISNEEVEYEIIIIEPGFNSWLISNARPIGYYSQDFLESRNIILVNAWNMRAIQPQVFDPNLYQLQIDYDPKIDYGYEVNYKLYYYFIYFQLHYKQQLSSFYPRI